MASYAENVSIWWRHHGNPENKTILTEISTQVLLYTCFTPNNIDHCLWLVREHLSPKNHRVFIVEYFILENSDKDQTINDIYATSNAQTPYVTEQKQDTGFGVCLAIL